MVVKLEKILIKKNTDDSSLLLDTSLKRRLIELKIRNLKSNYDADTYLVPSTFTEEYSFDESFSKALYLLCEREDEYSYLLRSLRWLYINYDLILNDKNDKIPFWSKEAVKEINTLSQ